MSERERWRSVSVRERGREGGGRVEGEAES